MSNAKDNSQPGGTGSPEDDAESRAELLKEHHQRLHEKFGQRQHQDEFAQTSTHPHDPVPSSSSSSSQPYYAQGQPLQQSPHYTAKSEYSLADFKLLDTL
ncbi:hypothetical protein BGX34_003708, partial [Mortierella sp. NVP85]